MNSNFLDKTYQYLLIGLGFVTPLTVAGGSLLSVLIFLVWALSGNYQQKFTQIMENKIAVASILFFIIHAIGLLWTSNMEWGFTIIIKMLPFLLLLPICLTITKDRYTEYYIRAFLLAMGISEFLSYAIYFEIISPFGKATVYDPTPFIDHISYNIFLTIAVYTMVNKLLFDKIKSAGIKYSYMFFIITMSINMFITGGRSGQVIYLVIIFMLAVQFFNKNLIKAIIISTVAILAIFTVAYNAGGIFSDRVNSSINNIQHYDNNANTSVGLRITFLKNSLEIIKNNLLFGVGTGDYPNEYKKINTKNTPATVNTTNPHNMFVLVWAQTGLVGLMLMLLIFYQQIKYARKITNTTTKNLAIAIPLLFLVIMWSDSYLLGHNTKLLFIFFSAFLYKTNTPHTKN